MLGETPIVLTKITVLDTFLDRPAVYAQTGVFLSPHGHGSRPETVSPTNERDPLPGFGGCGVGCGSRGGDEAVPG